MTDTELPKFDTPTLCADPNFDPEWWHPVTRADDYTADMATRICQQCPSQAACLEWATGRTVEGIWGGQTARQRETARRRTRTPAVPLRVPRLLPRNPARSAS